MSHTLYVLLRTGLSLGLVLALMLHASGYSTLPLLTQLELFAYDARLRLTLPGDVDTRIVIVDVDEASLAREGRWPWPRQRVAQLVDTLFSHYQVRLVAFDMVFAEAQTDPTLIAVDRLAQGVLRDDAAFMQQWISLRPQLDDDTLLADSFRDRDVVTGYYFASYGQNSGDLKIGRLPAPAASLSTLAPCVRIDVASPWGVLCESGASWEPGPSRPREVTGKEPVGRLEGHLPRARREPAGSLIVREQSNGDNLFP